MKATEFDKIFDDDEEDIVPLLDLATTHRPGVKIPNAATCKAIAELEAGKGKRCTNVDELMADLQAEDCKQEEALLLTLTEELQSAVKTAKSSLAEGMAAVNEALEQAQSKKELK